MALISRKKLRLILAAAGFLLLLQSLYYTWQLIAIGAAYKAKVLCSGVFLSKRGPQEIMREDMERVLGMIDAKIDSEAKSVTTSFPGVPSQHAVFRERLGCTLVPDAEDLKAADMSTHELTSSAKQGRNSGLNGSVYSRIPKSLQAKLAKALDNAFFEADTSNPTRTRAIVVAHHGRIIAERYAPGFSTDTPLPGWSLAKSVTNALVGILVYQGKLTLDQPLSVPEWSKPGDPRQAITMDHLLRMTSGLKFGEWPGPFVSDVNLMLLQRSDAGAFALDKPLKHDPGTHWQYSSGTTNIISRIIRNSVGNTVSDYHAFPRKALFDKIGMTSVVMEVDASGTFVGSSFIYATARDWARFGMLYLNNGVWEGERLLPKGWVEYTTRPTPAAHTRPYGAHFWLNRNDATSKKAVAFPKLPPDLYYASGYEGQFVVIIPSQDLVVVRLGMTRGRKQWDMEAFVSEVLGALASTSAVAKEQ